MTDRIDPRGLPENVRRIVDEIENEIGDDDASPDAGSVGEAGSAPGGERRVEAAVRQILLEIGEDPDSPRASAPRPTACTGCTTS